MKKTISFIISMLICFSFVSTEEALASYTQCELGKTYTYQFTNSKTNVKDVYFKLDKSGKIKIEQITKIIDYEGEPIYIDGMVSISKPYTLTLYDNNGNELLSKNYESIGDDPFSKEIPLSAGVYRLKFVAIGREISFSINYKPIDETYIEFYENSNNSVITATNVQFNKNIIAQLGINDPIDYYKFTVDRKSNISVKINYTLSAYSTGNPLAQVIPEKSENYFSLLNSQENEIKYNGYSTYKTEVYYDGSNPNNYHFPKGYKYADSYTYVLNPGTYYIAISDKNINEYNFTINKECEIHSYTNVVTKATLSKNGSITPTCSICGAKKAATTIYYPKTITLSATSYTYDGKVKKPTVTVKDANGNVIDSSNYTVAYSGNCTDVGKYNVTVTFKGNYEGAKTLTFEIVKKGTNQWLKSGNRWWYRHADGSYTKNAWEKIDGKWYHFDKSGWMQTGWLKDGGKWYYLNSSGVMTTGWQKISGKWYYMNSSGVMQTGWLKLGGKWYYMNSSGVMLTGRQKIGNKWYTFNSSGVWVR